MKNKNLLSILFIFFYCISINTVTGEEIIFETPTIEASDNGNILIANKGGKAIIDDKIEIIGDKFKYNKKDKILSVSGKVIINDNVNHIMTKSEKIIYYNYFFILI